MKLKVFQKLFHPQTPAAQQEYEQFKARYDAHLRGVDLVALTILVWGPGTASTSRVLQKRKQIRQELLDTGHVALFSEDLDEQVSETGERLSLRSRELAQAKSAHLVVILVEDSPGAIAEAEDFAIHPDIVWKTLVLVPEKYRDGYSAQGTFRLLEDGFGGVHWYTEDDLRSCNVLSRVLVRVQARREIYAIHL